MKTLTQQMCTVVCLSSALLAGAATAASSQTQGGVIHFVGAIVEDPCQVATGQQNIAMHCYRDGKMHTSTISYQQAMAGKLVNDDSANVSLHYLNPQKTLGIVTIVYR